MESGERVLRAMQPDDVDAVLDAQEPASVAGLAAVFPQDLYPSRGRPSPGVGGPSWLSNARGRAFWEKVGWQATGERSRGAVPPHAELLTYELRPPIDRNQA